MGALLEVCNHGHRVVPGVEWAGRWAYAGNSELIQKIRRVNSRHAPSHPFCAIRLVDLEF